MHKTLTTCPYCGCGCGLYLTAEGDRLIGSHPSRHHPVSQGSLCVKGWNAHEFVNSPDRLTTPLIRRNGELRPASWSAALALVAEKLTGYRDRHGPGSVACLSSAKTTNEENYLMMKLARTVFRTNNVDHCARLCHSSTVVGLAAAFGSGAMTNSIPEFEAADLFLITGSDTTAQHPLIGSRIIKAVKDRGAQLIVIDPREIELAKYATIYARPKNGTDVAWINGLLRIILAENLHDEAFVAARTEGLDALRPVVGEYPPERVEALTGIPAATLVDIARRYARARRAMIVYSMGITQHTTGVDNVKSLANLALLTGHLGFECAGVNPLRGQNNVQGSCDMGALPNVFSGYQPVTDAAAREKFARAWQVPGLPAEPGLTVTEIIGGAGRGTIKGLYIMGENPALSDPDSNHVRECLERTEFLVVQDLFLTETTAYADVVLPGASFAEKDGTFTSTERRVERIRRAVAPPGKAKPDWQILGALAEKAGYGGMRYPHPGAIMDEIAGLTPSYGGIAYARLEPFGLQWPCPTPDHPGTPVLHRERFTRGKGGFTPVQYRPPAEPVDADYPFLLSTGRIYWHFHTGTMTRRTSTLEREAPGPYVELHPDDAGELKVRNGERVRVRSRRGTIELRAQVSPIVAPKSVFIPFHFQEAAANLLTIAAVDPIAKIPEYKVCAVSVEKI